MFGTTKTYTGGGVDGQDITITSSETVGLNTTTDTFTVSTPSNFIKDDSLGGNVINALQFDLSDANSGTTPVLVVLPITTYTATGSTVYLINNTETLTPTTTVPSDGSSYSAAEGVNSGSITKPIDGAAVQSFTYSITYATLPLSVPEPSMWAMLAIGTTTAVLVIRRRGKTALY